MVQPEYETHLTALEVARYLDGKSSGAERERVEAHFADCVDCRHDFTSAKALVGRAGRWPRRVTGVAATLLAASIVLVVGTHRSAERDASDRSAVRGATGDASQLVVHAPTRATRAGAVHFVWGAVPGALSYEFTLSRADGTPVWARGGADTALTLPDSVALQPGGRYLWTADALLSDGSARTTGVQQLDVMP